MQDKNECWGEGCACLCRFGVYLTVGSCAQRRVILMPWAIELHVCRDALLNDRRESAMCFERSTKQVLALATEP